MTFLPIQFRTRIKSNLLKEEEILDIIEEYLNDERFFYIKRKSDKIIFHKADGWTSWKFKSFLVSGVVKIKKTNGVIEIINGNWMVFLISLPFLILILLGKSEYSTFDETDFMILNYFFIVGFGGNLITRIFAHLSFRNKIKTMMENN
ncbi:hypothetical protein P700755_000201 [Psychroflexus torquis ATCC 700755]|uniref:Uncharacterized protein n=1 Tax=Psychroflexus torquis (strain ATCC 700755 / CIP 106069 / ACAM 623) TaxID=313595 RepID=K4INY2_PSYTT|nr:hypothetical protein [Psychroflexus torquis]AFU67255.1 hypothetical protein P700755_000201 [Psychroflexus torquis ATCC 700755]